ncbi:hypothetical protein KDN32_17875 [Nocardioides sp. J2M5]|uniref:hypothetical protein n=1 Tax=Nocardioides palaemonis TaxID=2829810 RepID=UPI001BA8F623|nr:hypothetical protein [Nocardioides palaemonis]MBS2939612.1 hypothetical protein [Nocardioides palaemonis]
MDDVLADALAPVLRDLARAGIAAPRFEDSDWGGDDQPAAMMWDAGGSGAGVSVLRSAAIEESIAWAAEQVQDWAIENQLWGTAPTNWPPCPGHPDAHPLQPRATPDGAVWTCPKDRVVVAPVGDLPPACPRTTDREA